MGGTKSDEWSALDQRIIDNAVARRRQRLEGLRAGRRTFRTCSLIK